MSGALGEPLLGEVAEDRLPKHGRVLQALRALIDELVPGASMPSERELCTRFAVARGTVRQALGELEAEGSIERRRGSGTYVSSAKIDQVLELTSHSEDMWTHGIEPASRLLGVTRTAASAEVAERLGIAAGSEALQIERVRLAGGEPVALELVYLAADRFDGIAASLGESVSLYHVLESAYGVELDSAEETIEAITAAAREAALLNVVAGTPLFQLRRQTFDTRRRPVEYVCSLYRADRFRFRTRLQRVPTASSPRLPAGMRLRLASLKDAEQLASVFVAAWRTSYLGVVPAAVLEALDVATMAERFCSLLAERAGTITLIESVSGEVLGFSRHGRDPERAGRGHLYSLYVSPTATGRGLGSALLTNALAKLAKEGHDEVSLWVFAENKPARRLYARFGFEEEGTRRVEREYGAEELLLVRPATPMDASR